MPLEITDQDGVVLMRVDAPPARLLAQGSTVRRTATWSAYERARFLAPWFLLGLAIGATIDLALRWAYA